MSSADAPGSSDWAVGVPAPDPSAVRTVRLHLPGPALGRAGILPIYWVDLMYA